MIGVELTHQHGCMATKTGQNITIPYHTIGVSSQEYYSLID